MRAVLLLPIFLLLLFSACSQSNSLEITSSIAGQEARSVTIDCDEACEQALKEVEIAPVPKNAACTKLYGGPEEIALFSSSLKIDATFNKLGGCEITRFESLEPFLDTVGVTYNKLFPGNIS